MLHVSHDGPVEKGFLKSAPLLSVPCYDFGWQLTYELKSPLRLPAGARIDCIAHFDNSPNNKFNPDPAREVRWGDQTKPAGRRQESLGQSA